MACSWPLLYVIACGRPAASSHTNDLPAECQSNFGSALAAGLGGLNSGTNGGRNTVVEEQHRRCELALQVRRDNQRIALEAKQERQRAENEERADNLRACAVENAPACLASCSAGEKTACALLGLLYMRGKGGASQDTAMAKLYLQQACSMGDASSCSVASQVETTAFEDPEHAKPATKRILIFGGTKHDVFLGCLCDATDDDSVESKSGNFGPNAIALSNASLWASMSEYRSSFGNLSACNPYATDPPVVVLSDGTFVGRLTANAFDRQRVQDDDLSQWVEKVLCAH